MSQAAIAMALDALKSYVDARLRKQDHKLEAIERRLAWVESKIHPQYGKPPPEEPEDVGGVPV